jgi:hypothetical protein
MSNKESRAAYRPMPKDFPKLFVEFGWGGVGVELGAHRRSIMRWLNEAGAEELRQKRREFLERQYAESGRRVPGAKPGRSRSARYVLGRTMQRRD